MAPTSQQQGFMIFQKSTKNMPMHPIVSACGTATYNTAKFITKILQNYCGKISSFAKDCKDSIQKIKQLSVNLEEETVITFIIKALFASLQLPVVLQFINAKISTCIIFTNVYRNVPIGKKIISNWVFCFNRNFIKN